jgi:hypothetical protein
VLSRGRVAQGRGSELPRQSGFSLRARERAHECARTARHVRAENRAERPIRVGKNAAQACDPPWVGTHGVLITLSRSSVFPASEPRFSERAWRAVLAAASAAVLTRAIAAGHERRPAFPAASAAAAAPHK